MFKAPTIAQSLISEPRGRIKDDYRSRFETMGLAPGSQFSLGAGSEAPLRHSIQYHTSTSNTNSTNNTNNIINSTNYTNQ